MKYGKSVTIVLSLLLIAFAQLGATTYYVSSSDPAASDSNAGTSSSAPWATIAKVNSSSFSAGDQVLFKKGDKWREGLNFPSSGTETNKITIGSYGSGTDKPTISGGTVLPNTGWMVHDSANNIYKKPLTWKAFALLVDDEPAVYRLFPADLLEDNQFCLYLNELYYRDSTGSPNTTGKTFDAAIRSHAISIVSNPNVIIDGFQLECTNSALVNLSNSPRVEVRNCALRAANSDGAIDAAGVNISSCRYAIVENNTFEFMYGEGVFGKGAKDCLIKGNVIGRVDKGQNRGGDCIQLSGSSADANDGYQIIDNYVTQIGTNGFKGCIQLERGSNGIVRGNVALGGTFGIEVNGNNIIVEHNICAFQGVERPQDTFTAGIYLSEKKSYDGVIIRYNLVYDTLRHGIHLSATNGGGSPPFDRTNFKIHNNTVFRSGLGIKISDGYSGDIKNNVVWGFGDQLLVERITSGQTLNLDRNVWGPLDDPNEVHFDIAGTTYKTLADLQAAGYGTNSTKANPEFVDYDTDDYRIYSISSANDLGTSFGSGLTDLAGNAVPASGSVNAGCYETVETGGTATTITIVDNDDSTGVTKVGSWNSSSSVPGFYDTNYNHDNQSGKGTKTITFAPNLPTADDYKVYARWSTGSSPGNRADNVPTTINYDGGSETVTVNQQIKSGAWTLLGEWAFNAGTSGNVTVATTGTSGFVTADAFRFETARDGTAPPPPPPPPSGSEIYFEAESASATPWAETTDSNACDNAYMLANGGSSFSSPPSDGSLNYDFDVDTNGTTVAIWFKVLTPSGNDDSYWVRVNSQSWDKWDTGFTHSSNFYWRKWDEKTLNAGTHTLEVKYRENGAGIDQILVTTDTGLTPSGCGSTGSGGGTTVEVEPSADAYVRDGSDSTSNFGTATNLIVKDDNDSFQDRDSYLKFDVSSLSGSYTTVNLSIVTISPNAGETHIYSVTDDTWTETGITWDTKPAKVTKLDTVNVPGTGGTEVLYDVTSFVNNQIAGDGTVSLVIVQENEEEVYMAFESRENTNKPLLILEP